MSNVNYLLAAGLILSFVCLTGFVVARVTKAAPDRLARVLLAMATLFGTLPPIIQALWAR